MRAGGSVALRQRRSLCVTREEEALATDAGARPWRKSLSSAPGSGAHTPRQRRDSLTGAAAAHGAPDAEADALVRDRYQAFIATQILLSNLVRRGAQCCHVGTRRARIAPHPRSPEPAAWDRSATEHAPCAAPPLRGARAGRGSAAAHARSSSPQPWRAAPRSCSWLTAPRRAAPRQVPLLYFIQTAGVRTALGARAPPAPLAPAKWGPPPLSLRAAAFSQSC
jgi:hypothetical protein